MRRAVALLAALGFTAPAGAHAFLDSATPPVGATVAAAPAAVTIRFTEQVEPLFRTLAVSDAAGHRVDKGPAHLVGGDAAVLAVDLPKLPPGAYVVEWHATSVDTHRTEGRFGFTVAP